MTTSQKGSLTVVGTGISLSGQMTIVTESVLKNADVVFAVVTDSALVNLKHINPNTHCMRHHYEAGKPRLQTYNDMQQTLVDAVVSGKKVAAAFYGHPGVFVYPSHQTVKVLRQMGYEAKMLPGISAEDCIVADLGIDPAEKGCQTYEATQFLFRQYTLDPYMMQIVWQIGAIAEFNMVEEITSHELGMTILRDELLVYFPPDHTAIVYEAAILPFAKPRIEKVALRDLHTVVPTGISTLVLPGLALPDFDDKVLAKFNLTREQVVEKLHITVQNEK